MNLRSDVLLQPYLSLALPVRARWLAEIENTEALAEIADWTQRHPCPLLLLGGGTNTVVQRDCDGLVIRIAIKGRASEVSADGTVRLRIGAGEDWPRLVRYCQQQGWSGLENLAMIPGTVGAAPVRNIGAYGRELVQVLEKVEVFDFAARQCREIDAADCGFSYRNSVFLRRDGQPDLIVTAVHLRLQLASQGVREDQLAHPAVRQSLADGQVLSSEQLYRRICELRTARLPNPADLPNVGSFFVNPWVTKQHWRQLQSRLPDLPSRCEAGGYRLSAAWLIAEAGWKGHRRAGVGVWQHHSLILVNHGEGDGKELIQLAEDIRADIAQRHGVQLAYEPLIY